MGGMDLIFTPLLGPPGLYRPMTSKYFLDLELLLMVQLEGSYNLPLAAYPPPPPTSLLPAHPPFIRAISDIKVVVKKVAQNPAVLASYYYRDRYKTLARRLL